MRGDLVGWSRWTVGADGTGARALFEEDARPGHPLLRRLAVPLHPVFRANHAVMMRRGRRGLAAHLARRDPGDRPGGTPADRPA